MKQHRITTGTSPDVVSLLGTPNNYEYHGEIIDKLNNIMRHVEYDYYAKCFYMRLDFSFPVDNANPTKRIYPGDNFCFSEFLRDFNERLDLLGLAPIYLWVREFGPHAVHQHYHLGLWLRGDKVQSIYNIAKEAEKHWGRTLSRMVNSEPHKPFLIVPEVGNGLVDYCNDKVQNGILLRKDDDLYAEFKTQIYTACMYLCKTATKPNFLPGRNMGSSAGF